MAIVDDQGRLFGRLNLLDAIVGVLVLGLIPLAYGAYVLFRTPMPVMTSVVPAEITDGPNMRILIRGENLKPYLRVSVGAIQGQTFLFRDASEAEVDLRGVPPGTYDVVLYDFAQERSRLPQALTVHPSVLPDAKVVVVGLFGNLQPEQASSLKVGMVIPSVGEVIAVGQPVPQIARIFSRPNIVQVPVPNSLMVPVTMRMGCWVRSVQGEPECVANSVGLHPLGLLFLPTPMGTLPFQVDRVRGTQPLVPLDITVRFSGTPEALAMLKPGDQDWGAIANELSIGGTVTGVSGGGATRDARLTVDGQQGTAGWLYDNQPLRVGGGFTLTTPGYELSGTVVRVTPQSGAGR
ncbi:MAG: DUF4330 family protein [Vicinamibacterales bacterium]